MLDNRELVAKRIKRQMDRRDTKQQTAFPFADPEAAKEEGGGAE
jgi:hypothetical protein